MKLHNKHQAAFLAIQLAASASLFIYFDVFKKHLLEFFLVYFAVHCVGGTVFYHRYLSHKSFKISNWGYFFCLFASFWGLYGSPVSWSAIHRQHHRHTDTVRDPHSPFFKSIFDVQLFSFLAKPNFRYVKDLLEVPSLVFVHRYYFLLHGFLSVVLLLISWEVFLYAYLWPAFFTWHFASLTNSVCHVWGYRNFSVADKSRNNPIIAFLTFGEGWHNNHHARPRRPSFREKWWELDPGAWIIQVIEAKSNRSTTHSEKASSLGPASGGHQVSSTAAATTEL